MIRDIHEPTEAIAKVLGIPLDDLTYLRFEQEVGGVAMVLTRHHVLTVDNTVESVELTWKPAQRAHFRYLRLKSRRRVARWWK